LNLGEEQHNFEFGPVVVKDRSVETIAVRSGLFALVLFLLFFIGRL